MCDFILIMYKQMILVQRKAYSVKLLVLHSKLLKFKSTSSTMSKSQIRFLKLSYLPVPSQLFVFESQNEVERTFTKLEALLNYYCVLILWKIQHSH